MNYHANDSAHVYQGEDPPYGLAEQWRAAVRDENDDVVATARGPTCEEAITFAGRIARALNEYQTLVASHAALLAACEYLASTHGKVPRFVGSVFIECARDMARAAIAQAKAN